MRNVLTTGIRRMIGRGRRAPEVERWLARDAEEPLPPEVPIPAFAIGTGRSGTHFMHELMEEDPTIASYHTDTLGLNVGDSFQRYCVWNDLPIDHGEFLRARRRLIAHHALGGRRYFESNSYVSLCVTLFHEAFGSRFLLMTRSPDRVVNSHYVKGWYLDKPPRFDPNRAHGFQYGYRKPNHGFRILPRGAEHERWIALTRVGRIAWMWNAYYLRILAQLDRLPAGRWRQVRLEEVDYPRYLELHEFIGGGSPLAAERFEAIRHVKPGKAKWQRTKDAWTARETAEFLTETAEARAALGYSDGEP